MGNSMAGMTVAAVALAALLGFSRWPSAGVVDSELHRFRIVQVAAGLRQPWGLAFLPDGRLLVTERHGALRLVEDGRLRPGVVEGLPAIAAHGQGGLMDVVLHPDFAANGWVYLSYSTAGEGGIGTEVARGRLEGMVLRDVEVIFRALPKSLGGRHFGSRLLFNPDGTLFVTLGDRGEQPDRAQDLGDHAGSLVRIHDDGSVPGDNPFAGRTGARPEIYTYGNRNIQGIDRSPDGTEVWMTEFGPRGGDELNRVKAGANYGWPVVTHGLSYAGTAIGEGTAREGMEPPVWHWTPSISPSGIAFYSGAAFPRWRGDLLVAGLGAQVLVRLRLDGGRVAAEERLLQRRLGRLRHVRQGPDGFIYVLSESAPGAIYRLEPADP